GEPMTGGWGQVGHPAGWLALLASVGVVFWHADQSSAALRVHVLGALGAGVVVLASCTPNSTTPPWTSYHVLIAAGVLYALAFLIAGVLAASPRLLEFFFPAPPNSQGGDTNKWPGWLSDLLPARAVQAWLPGIGLALVLLGLRGGWTDPERPYWSVAAVLTASVVAAALASWGRRQSYVYASGVMANPAGILVCVRRGPAPRPG